MKWLVYGCGLLISSAVLVALSMSGALPALGGIGSGLLTGCVYFLGVYLAPRLIIHRLQQCVPKEKRITEIICIHLLKSDTSFYITYK